MTPRYKEEFIVTFIMFGECDELTLANLDSLANERYASYEAAVFGGRTKLKSVILENGFKKEDVSFKVEKIYTLV